MTEQIEQTEQLEPVLYPGKPSRFNRRSRWLWTTHLLPLGRFDSYLEIGCFEALTLLWAAEHLVEAGGWAVGIDPYAGLSEGNAGDESHRVALDRVAEFHARLPEVHVEIIRQTSQEALLTWLEDGRGRPGIVFVDGLHNAPEALLDNLLAWSLLPVGGILVSDDTHVFELSRRWRREPMSQEAWQAFEECHAGRFETVFRVEHQVAVRKVK